METLAEVEEMTVEQGRAMLGGLAHDTLGISADEFLARLDAGAYDDVEREDVLRMVMLVPFAR